MHLQTKTAAQGHPVQRSVREKRTAYLLCSSSSFFFWQCRLPSWALPSPPDWSALPGDAQRLRRHVLGDGAAGGGVGTIAHLHGGYKVRVAADEAVIADCSAELILAVVVAGDGAAAEVAVLAHVAVADVGQVADRVAAGKLEFLVST